MMYLISGHVHWVRQSIYDLRCALESCKPLLNFHLRVLFCSWVTSSMHIIANNRWIVVYRTIVCGWNACSLYRPLPMTVTIGCSLGWSGIVRWVRTRRSCRKLCSDWDATGPWGMSRLASHTVCRQASQAVCGPWGCHICKDTELSVQVTDIHRHAIYTDIADFEQCQWRLQIVTPITRDCGLWRELQVGNNLVCLITSKLDI